MVCDYLLFLSSHRIKVVVVNSTQDLAGFLVVRHHLLTLLVISITANKSVPPLVVIRKSFGHSKNIISGNKKYTSYCIPTLTYESDSSTELGASIKIRSKFAPIEAMATANSIRSIDFTEGATYDAKVLRHPITIGHPR